jgi:hypothetical protein
VAWCGGNVLFFGYLVARTLSHPGAAQNVGVMKLVGDVSAGLSLDNPPPVIGVASWGVVAGREHLVRAGPTTASADVEVDYDRVVFCEAPAVSTNSLSKAAASAAPVALDPNHSFFILVDDGTENKFGGEIEFRSNFETMVRGQPGVFGVCNWVWPLIQRGIFCLARPLARSPRPNRRKQSPSSVSSYRAALAPLKRPSTPSATSSPLCSSRAQVFAQFYYFLHFFSWADSQHGQLNRGRR